MIQIQNKKGLTELLPELTTTVRKSLGLQRVEVETKDEPCFIPRDPRDAEIETLKEKMVARDEEMFAVCKRVDDLLTVITQLQSNQMVLNRHVTRAPP